MRRLILLDLLLVAVLGWLLWTIWADSKREQANPAPRLPELSPPAELEGLDY